MVRFRNLGLQICSAVKAEIDCGAKNRAIRCDDAPSLTPERFVIAHIAPDVTMELTAVDKKAMFAAAPNAIYEAAQSRAKSAKLLSYIRKGRRNQSAIRAVLRRLSCAHHTRYIGPFCGPTDGNTDCSPIFLSSSKYRMISASGCNGLPLEPSCKNSAFARSAYSNVSDVSKTPRSSVLTHTCICGL